jgi:hypothetical protein
MKIYYMPLQALAKLLWLQNFSGKIGNYATKYGIATATITDIQNGYAYLAYWMNSRNQYQEYVKKLSAFKDEIIKGTGIASAPPTAPTFGAVPTAVAPGVFTRVTSLVNTIKSNLAYTEADGKDLGIEGIESSSRFNLHEAQPQISVRLIGGGHPEVVWSKGDFESVDIFVDRGTGNWVFLATDTHPNYTDTAALPAIGTSALWHFKAIYKLDDERVGQFSNPVSITVAGV